MLALITNDDGIGSPGILALEEAARQVFDECIVVAPKSQQSAASHAISLRRTFRIQELDSEHFAVDAKPADCVFIALRELLPKQPDFVLSGCNIGPNLGYDTLYSGTVAAAREGLMSGIPSLAFSLAVTYDVSFEQIVPWVRRVLEGARSFGLPPETMLNVNVPSEQMFGAPKGFRFTGLGQRVFDNRTTVWEDPGGGLHGWIGGREFAFEGDEDTDCYWLSRGYVTVSPLTWNLACNTITDRESWLSHMNRMPPLSK